MDKLELQQDVSQVSTPDDLLFDRVVSEALNLCRRFTIKDVVLR